MHMAKMVGICLICYKIWSLVLKGKERKVEAAEEAGGGGTRL